VELEQLDTLVSVPGPYPIKKYQSIDSGMFRITLVRRCSWEVFLITQLLHKGIEFIFDYFGRDTVSEENKTRFRSLLLRERKFPSTMT
jgi:hypothetical protein